MIDPNAVQASSMLDAIQQKKPFHSKGQEAYLALVRTADDAKRKIGRLLEAAGVTLQQYNVLRILRGAGAEGLPTLTIGHRMIERTPGVTRIVDRMETKGWVERRRCTEDRRRVWCHITENGLALLDELDAPVRENDNSVLEVLDDDEVLRLIDYLGRVRAHLNREEH